MNSKVLHASRLAILITSTPFFSVHAMQQRRTVPPVITNMQLTAKEEALLDNRISNDILVDCLEFSASALGAVALTGNPGHALTTPQTCLLAYNSLHGISMAVRTNQFEHDPALKKAFAVHLQLSALIKKAQHAKELTEYAAIKKEAKKLYPKEFAISQPTAPTYSEKCFYATQDTLCMNLPILNTIGRSVFLHSSVPPLQRQVDLFNYHLDRIKTRAALALWRSQHPELEEDTVIRID